MQNAESRRQKIAYRRLLVCLLPVACCLLFFISATAQVGDFEGRPVTAVEVVFEGTPADASAQAEFRSMLKVVAGSDYSAAAARQSLHDLFASGRVASARIEITETGAATGSGVPIRVRFVIQRQIVIAGVTIRIGPTLGTPVPSDEIRARLNLLEPGRRFSIAAIERNADEIQIYMRDRGYYNATVEHEETPDPADSTGTRRIVVYTITPGQQAHIGQFNIEITGFDATVVRPSLKLQPGGAFTRDILGDDLSRIKQALIANSYMAPQLNDPRVEFDSEKNEINVKLEGKTGPKVEVTFEHYKLSEKKQQQLLPIKREGALDYSILLEGARRVRNRLQEQGYFFSDVIPLCTVTPAIPNQGENGTEEACENLNPQQLDGSHTIKVVYDVILRRQLRLKDIRITGTNKLTIEDILPQLKSRKTSGLAFLPFIGGLGRGFTSAALLQQDERTVTALMKDLGYRDAKVSVLQGISPTEDNLIITFQVTEGRLTRVAEIEIEGEKAFTEDRLRQEITIVKGSPYSRSQVRADSDQILNLYAREGFIEADVRPSIDELPRNGEDEQVRVVFTVAKEGAKAIVKDIVVNGVTGSASAQESKRAAIRRAIPLLPGDVLRADRITEAERALYVTDAFRQVVISQQPAGDAPNGAKLYDIIIDVEEKRPRVIEYGGGYSSDAGALGLLELTNVNFMNKLRTAALRIRASQRQQLLRVEFLDPRFFHYGRSYAPLAISAQYLRDSTITRFFRSTIDRGNFGVVQRFDEDGNPIDQFGNKTGQPTIDRLSFSVETQRVLSQKSHSILFLRYNYEDVRLRNIESLLIKDILRQDAVVRLSRFGTSFVYDTRERCERRLPGTVYGEDETIRGGEVCRYNQVDATRGQFLSADYSFASKALGGNTSFSRFLSTYHTYYKLNQFRKTVFAGNLTVGLAKVFSARDRNGNGRIDDFDQLLPISERFFSGGSTTLRGFGFEEAGPRQVIVPQGTFRRSSGEIITLDPFTVPIGGNAMVVMNLEARVPMTPDVQVVPFYDGGNVFRSMSDIAHPKPITPSGNFVEDVNAQNLRVRWSHTVGLGFRFKTPLGGALAIDYGFLLNPSRFLIPQNVNTLNPTTAIYRLHQGQIQFRFTQTF